MQLASATDELSSIRSELLKLQEQQEALQVLAESDVSDMAFTCQGLSVLGCRQSS